MKIDSGIIRRVAELARLELDEGEMELFSRQLSDIIGYVEKINQMDTDSVQPTDHIVDLKNVFRQDAVGRSLAVEEIERIAPRFANNHIVVPKIIEEY